MVNEEILYFLKKRPGYISGEEISQELGISRSAIWKHIQELRESGYDIAAVPHLGYSLFSCPDRLFPWEIRYLLKSRFIAKTIYYYENLSSTMDRAMELAFNGAPEGTLVIAEGQSKGRGRLGRLWLSPKYKGIYFSLIIKPDIIPQQAPVLTLISAVAICEGLKQQLGLQAQIKWPNDILLNNQKVGGILTELSAETDTVYAIIVGVGINVNNDRKTLPDSASSLKEIIGHEVFRLGVLQGILSCFEKRYIEFQKQGMGRILEKWRHFNVTLGRRIKINMSKQRLQLVGEAIDIDQDGGLLIRNDSGLIERVMAGDIIHCKR